MKSWKVWITLNNPQPGDENGFPARLMYMIVWQGKALSGHETLIRTEDIAEIEITFEDE